MTKRIGETWRKGTHIRVEIIDSANADWRNILERNTFENSGCTSGKRELLLADLHVDLVCCGTCGSIE